jgi:DNA-binding LacI/PurR family transcriptional regulator
MQKLLSLKKRPTAVIAFNDYVALDVIKYTRGQGLKINKDIFFVSYANLPITSYLDEPLLVSVEQYPYEQAERATEILIRLINSKGQLGENTERKVILESKLIVHDSLR